MARKSIGAITAVTSVNGASQIREHVLNGTVLSNTINTQQRKEYIYILPLLYLYEYDYWNVFTGHGYFRFPQTANVQIEQMLTVSQ